MTRETNPLAVLGTLLRVALIMALASSVLGLAVPGFLLLSATSYDVLAAVDILGGIAILGGLGAVISSLACIVLVPIWTWFAQANLWKAQLDGLRYGANWSAIAWFVPVANLFVPLGVMKQLYNRSLGESEYQEADGIGVVTAWWTCAIAWLVVTLAIGSIMFVPFLLPGAFVTMPPMGEAGLLALSALLQIGACWYLFRIVSAITRAQKESLYLGQASTFA